MPIKKSDLYSTLWKSCDELRGGMDASQYKDYVLVMLFMRYVSDKYANNPTPLIEVPEGGGFSDMVALKGTKDIGDGINKIIAKLAEANDLKGVIDVADFNNEDKLGSGKEMVDRLTNLVSIFEDPRLDFSSNRAGGDDLLGDAYEYLMRNFATQSGKSKGQFYTPAEVSRVIAKVIRADQAHSQSQTIYDPTCGSGSLLLKGADESPYGLTIYGQEMDNATAAMARMNMILHENPTAEIWRGNTLADPHFKDNDGNLKLFDYVVANPPFSTKSWSNGFDPEHDLYNRFEYGIPPKRNGDYAFVLHILSSLKSTGKGAIVMPHGVLFRGNAEEEIRRNLITKGYIKGVISLPPNLFYGTGIPACILLLDKEQAGTRKGIFMIDASQGYMKDGAKNRLRHQDIRKIVDVFNGQDEIPGYSRLVPYDKIRENEYNLNIPRYIDTSEPEVIQDIEAHLKGGIPNRDIDALENFWSVLPSLKKDLFEPSDREGYSELNVEPEDIRPIIENNPDYQDFISKVNSRIAQWWSDSQSMIEVLENGLSPKQFIGNLSEQLLESFRGFQLINKYDVYQRLMYYWTQTMQDDVYMIVQDGWVPNQALIPPNILSEHFFSQELANIEELERKLAEISQKKIELELEHGSDEGLLSEVISAAGNITKSGLKNRIKEIDEDPEYEDELSILLSYQDLNNQESKLNQSIKKFENALSDRVKSKYSHLSITETKQIVITNKWFSYIQDGLFEQTKNILANINFQTKEIANRYSNSLSTIDNMVNHYRSLTNKHLEDLGFK